MANGQYRDHGPDPCPEGHRHSPRTGWCLEKGCHCSEGRDSQTMIDAMHRSADWYAGVTHDTREDD